MYGNDVPPILDMLHLYKKNVRPIKKFVPPVYKNCSTYIIELFICIKEIVRTM